MIIQYVNLEVSLDLKSIARGDRMNLKDIYNGAKTVASIGLLALTIGCYIPKQEAFRNTMIPIDGKNYMIRYGMDAAAQKIAIYGRNNSILFASNRRSFDNNNVELTDDKFDKLTMRGNDSDLRELASLDTMDQIWKDLH